MPHTTQADVPGRETEWLWLTLPITILVATTSAIGLCVPGFYRDPPGWAIQVIAQDFVDLAVVLPVLVSSSVLVVQGSQRAHLVWLGTLSYLIYTFVIYTFAVAHNALFLVYVAVFACSLWAFIAGLTRMQGRARGTVCTRRLPVKTVSSSLIIQATLFYLLWLSDEITAVVAGRLPQSLHDTGLLTNPVHVLDMAVLLPALVLSGIWLWRKQAIGYGVVAVLLVNLVFQGIGIAAIMGFSIYAGLPGSLWLAVVFLALSGGNLALLLWHLRGMKQSRLTLSGGSA
jgi:hypothetical protein